MVRTRPDDDQTECPVCLDKVRFGAETNCGHLFCGDCILRVWEENVNRTACIACPCCRQDVKMLLSCHSSAESSATSRAVIEEREHNKQRLADYNRLHSHDASVQLLSRTPRTIRRSATPNISTRSASPRYDIFGNVIDRHVSGRRGSRLGGRESIRATGSVSRRCNVCHFFGSGLRIRDTGLFSD